MWNRIVAGWLVVAAVTLGVGGIVLLIIPLGSFVQFGWPVRTSLIWDAGLSLFFFLQHSGMVRRSVRRRLPIPDFYWPAVYAAASGIVLIVVCLLWQSTRTVVFEFGPTLRIASLVCAAVVVLVFVAGVRALGQFDMLGVRAVAAHLQGVGPRRTPFIVRGPYRWVRHPLYSAILVLFWTAPDPTLDRLLFDILWTAWVVVSTRWEERDLVADFGADYERYQQTVPALVPWHAPRHS
jgi:protein-S-isoprenylcysteine O-methyltransferase Ste14